MYLGIYERLNEYEVNDEYNLGDYLLEIGNQNSEDVNLTRLYPVIGSMSYAQRSLAGMGGLSLLISTTDENKESELVEEKVSEAAENIKKITGRDSYSVWMHKDEQLKGKKVAYTSEAVRTSAASNLLAQQETTTWEEEANEISKWINLALGLVSCLLVITHFYYVACLIMLVPAVIVSLSAGVGLSCVVACMQAMGEVLAGGAAAASNPVGWITLAVTLLSMLVIWVVGELLKYIKENQDIDYSDAPDYAADVAVNSQKKEYLVYYKGAGSEREPATKFIGKKGKYSEEVVKNYHGKDGISDVNGRMGFRGWNCLFYSKDENVGSPIIVKGGQNPFRVVTGDGNPINGYDCVRSFGEITPSNFNAQMKKDEVNGIFVHYRTEESEKNASEGARTGTNEGKTTNAKQYFKKIIVCSSDTEAKAKAKVIDRGYKVWDQNLANDARKNYSRNEEWAYTYLGFELTDDPKEAITDIRVATFTPESRKSLMFGDVSYGCAGNLGYKADSKDEDKEYPEDLDGLWFTKSEEAGTPIPFGNLHLVSGHDNGSYAEKGWVPVTTFSGLPYNFASTREFDTTDWKPGRLGNSGYRYTYYGTDENYTWKCSPRYLYYEPETVYTSGTKYLSALFFTFGTDSESTGSKVGETEAKFTELVDYMKKTPNTVLDDKINLAKSFYYKGYVVESEQKYLHLGYSWSYNPYRALTDIKVFQGTIFSNELPYTLNKPVEYSGTSPSKSINYNAVTVVSQRTAGNQYWVMRGIGPENAYMSPSGLLGTNKQVEQGYTTYQPGGYDYAKGKMPFIATGLYVSGPVKDMDKLTLNDVVISSNAHTATNNGGIIKADLSGEKTLGGESAAGDFNSIQEMKNPYETKPFNIAYPEWTNDDGEHMDAGTAKYIYIRKTAQKKKYISRIFVGSFSYDDTLSAADKEEQKKWDLEKKIDERDRDAAKEIARQVDLNALAQANGAASDEVIPANVALAKNRTWYGSEIATYNWISTSADSAGAGYYGGDKNIKMDSDRLFYEPPNVETIDDGPHNDLFIPVDRPASYLSVSRTNDPDEAVRGILLYKSDAKTVPEKIQVGGVDYHCASISTPILMQPSTKGYENNCLIGKKSKKFSYDRVNYFLYYTTNKGVAPGQPFTELTVTGDVFTSGQTTALCVDKKDSAAKSTKDGRKTTGEQARPYGQGQLAQFIHAKYEKDSNMYFNKIFTAAGATKREALVKLLEQGCTEYCDLNLNEGVELTEADIEDDDKKKGGEYIYFGYRGYTINEEYIKKLPTKTEREKEREEEMGEAIYDVVCTIGEKFHPEGIQTDRYQMYYMPVSYTDENGEEAGTDLNKGTNGPEIYMYYTTTWGVNKYNEKVGKDTRKNLSPEPAEYFKSPLTRICFTRYDRVPYSPDAGAVASLGDDKRPWEYVMYSDYTAPVDLNDGTVKLDSDYHTENNRISMFAQREAGNVKGSAEITGGFISSTLEVGEMWLNR